MRRTAWFAMVLLTGLVLAACTAADEATLDVGDDPAAVGAVAEAPDSEESLGAPGLSGGHDVADDAAAPDAAGLVPGDLDASPQRAGEDVPPLPDPAPASAGDRIIKDGTVTIEVAEGGFDTAFGRVIDAASRVGGTVIASQTRTDDDGVTSGSVTVRVPVGAFEDLLVSVGRIGAVRQRDITAQDVTTEYVDLESRLRHLQAQERFYLGLLDRAQAVGDAIAVQQQLSGIQQQIEQVKGRIQYLDARTTFSTLTVELFEPGAPIIEVRGGPAERPTLAAYWERARDAFVNMVGALLVAVMFVAPVLVPVAAGFAVWRGVRRPPAPAAE
jgi:hypothetical protein